MTRTLEHPGRANGAQTRRRYRDIAQVLVSHGLADVVDLLHLGRPAAWSMRMLPRKARLDPSLSRAARLRLTLEELGPTFVKFGQALSVRSDLLPPDVIAELERLQDAAAPLAAGVAEAALAAEFGAPVGDLFAAFDPVPFAAASIAQVHHAILLTGESVVVKVRRPGIAPIIAADIEILRHLARLAERHAPGAGLIDPSGLVEEFARTIRAELDFRREAHNLERCAANFAGDPTVRFPRVYWQRTTAGVLSMEYLDGIRLGELDACGVPAADRAIVARRGADAMLAQVLVHGLFHADPHPGNLLLLPGNVIGFLDFGIVGRVDAERRQMLAKLIRAIWRREVPEVAALVLDITRPAEDVDPASLTADITELLERYGNVAIGDLSLETVLTDVVAAVARHRLQVPSDLMLLIKALVTIEGVGLRLDPGFKMVEHAAPFAERLLLEAYSPEHLGRRLAAASADTVHALRTLPGHLDVIGRKLRHGQLEVRFVHRNLEHFVREMDRSSNRLSFAIVIAALLIGSSLIIQSRVGPTVIGYPLMGLVGFLAAGVLGIGLIVGVLRSGRL